jgi:cell division septation protein DedD
LVPLQKSDLPLNNANPEAHLSALPAGNAADLGNSLGSRNVGYSPPAQVAQAPVQPAYALSVAIPAAQTPPRPIEKPTVKADRIAIPTRKWAVQVAALAGKKDADAMALGLRNSGYDAYVITSQVESKTWHRVRVGQFTEIGLAKQLKQSLVNAPQFKHAYVAAN